MHQIARIEFRNSKFPYARGLCPLDPRQGASPMEPPLLVNNFPEAGSAPAQTLVRGPDAKRGTLKNFDPL